VLTSEAVIGFLLARDLLTEQVLVEGDLRVEETPGRNRNFRVEAKGGLSYFLKQAPPDEVKDSPLQLEAEVYRRVLETESWSHLQPFVPRFRLFDVHHAVLVTDLELALSDVTRLDEKQSVLGLARMSDSLGHALANCHRADPSASASRFDFLPRLVPGILSLSRPQPSALQYLSPAQIQVIQVVQEQIAVQAAFEKIRSGWVERCLIHGDVKWVNVMVRVDAQPGNPLRVVLLDWELARLGDPAWDVGSVFHSYLVHTVLSAAVPDRASCREAAERIGAALPSFYGELGTFWETYVRASGASWHGGGELLRRSILCCVARLVQSAYEWSQNERTIPGRAAAILQLGINMLRNHDETRRLVLGELAEH
jgi:hypothetical protein